MSRVTLPQANMSVDQESDTEAFRKNIQHLADNAMEARRPTENGKPDTAKGADGDEEWRFVDGSLYLYRRHGGRWWRMMMEEV